MAIPTIPRRTARISFIVIPVNKWASNPLKIAIRESRPPKKIANGQGIVFALPNIKAPYNALPIRI
jgi:hypothetical protein